MINNQIGFTTDFEDARSSDYCTSLAAMIQAPVLHVNGDDAEAVVKCAEIATRYRQEFNSEYSSIWFVTGSMVTTKAMIPSSRNLICMLSLISIPIRREVYTNYLLENGEADAKELAKEMEKEILGRLTGKIR